MSSIGCSGTAMSSGRPTSATSFLTRLFHSGTNGERLSSNLTQAFLVIRGTTDEVHGVQIGPDVLGTQQNRDSITREREYPPLQCREREYLDTLATVRIRGTTRHQLCTHAERLSSHNE